MIFPAYLNSTSGWVEVDFRSLYTSFVALRSLCSAFSSIPTRCFCSWRATVCSASINSCWSRSSPNQLGNSFSPVKWKQFVLINSSVLVWSESDTVKSYSHVTKFIPIFSPSKNGLHGNVWGHSQIVNIWPLNGLKGWRLIYIEILSIQCKIILYRWAKFRYM